MLTLIKNGEIYAPEPIGKTSILLGAGKILKIGEIASENVEKLGIEYEKIDAEGCIVTPGFIDPHEHLLGGSGEKGFASQTPEIYPTEIIKAGITTAVGCLGVDTTMKTLAGLLAKVKALKEEGISAFMWTGGYDVPPSTISGTPRNDIMFIEEIIGAGEIAISDERSTDHVPHELARLVIDTHNGGMLAGKAGVTHFHVGTGEERLKPLTNLLEEFKVIKPEWLYATHITRSEDLMREAIELAGKGSFVDIDTVDEDLPKWFKFYANGGGDLSKLTVSTDCSITSPQNLLSQIRALVLDEKTPIEQVLPCVTANTAKVLNFPQKGRLRENSDADILIFEKDSLTLREVFANGQRLLKNGEPAFKEKFLEESNRRIVLEGANY
jgi:beta-aspartyl-dipeptidase (metallo-type)